MLHYTINEKKHIVQKSLKISISFFFFSFSLCLKITEKVAYNIASEANYVYILSGQKFIKNAKNGHFWKPEACSQIVLPDRSILITQIGGNAKIKNLKCDILGDFQTL